MPPAPPRILCVYAHPDDESFGPAHILARYARQGAEIFGLYATSGQHGQPVDGLAPSPEEMGRLREQDLREVARLIGFRDLELLGYEDGRVAEVPQERLEAQVLDAIRRHQPQVVLTFGPAGITRHPDHVAVHRAATAAFHRARQEGLPVRELYYEAVPPGRAAEMGLQDQPDGNPDTWIDVQEMAHVKLEALRLHARHVQDARERAQQLEREPQFVGTLYRAWPKVPPDGKDPTGFLQAPD